MTTKPLTNATFEDAKSVILARFPASALGVLAKTMDNPLRNDCPEIGDIAYDEYGRPVGFRAANRRRMHFCTEAILGRVRGLTCRLTDSSKAVMPALCDAQLVNPRGCKIAFSNTQSIPTERRAMKMGAIPGPESSTRMLCRLIRPVGFFCYYFWRKISKGYAKDKSGALKGAWGEFAVAYEGIEIRSETRVDKTFFDSLTAEYVKTNEGICSDRDGESISWLFGKEVEEGKVVLLCARKQGRAIGYVALKTDEFARHWLMVDWFALKNDEKILEVLLQAAGKFLHKCTPALICKVIGFPTFIQPLLRRYFPYVRKTGVNWFSYNFLDNSLAEKCSGNVDSKDSWFFGPFDGDLCM